MTLARPASVSTSAHAMPSEPLGWILRSWGCPSSSSAYAVLLLSARICERFHVASVAASNSQRVQYSSAIDQPCLSRVSPDLRSVVLIQSVGTVHVTLPCCAIEGVPPVSAPSVSVMSGQFPSQYPTVRRLA